MAENQEKDPMQQAMEDAKAAAAARKAARDAANAQEVAAQQALQAEELAGLQTYNTTQYENQGQIIKDIEGKLATAKEKDATAQKRENAYRYISGLGDTLSSLANLVGTAHGAANQQQTYNSSKVVQKAEEARKARKLEMDDLTKRQDEMKARLLEMKAAGSLKEAEIKARQAKENLALTSKHNAAEQAATQYDAAQIRQAGRDARADAVADRAYNEGVRQFNATEKRLADAKAAELETKEKIAAAEAKAKVDAAKAKKADDPKHQSSVMHQNIVGIRDELAKQMGYASYNEYLQYKNVSGWGTDIGEQRNKDSKAIRNKRAAENPEVAEFLRQLEMPESMSEEQIRALMGASTVFADAVGKATVEEEPQKTSNGKKKVW